MKLLLVTLEKSRNKLISLVVVVQVGHQSQIGMEGLGLFVVQGVEKINSVLIYFVRKVGKQSLLDQIRHLYASHVGRVSLQEVNDVVLDHKFPRVLFEQHRQEWIGPLLLSFLGINVEPPLGHVPSSSIGWHDVVSENSEQVVL